MKNIREYRIKNTGYKTSKSLKINKLVVFIRIAPFYKTMSKESVKLL
jgi:hypothetical protein